MTQENTKERPILFSGPMVRALLAGQKTQTRRVMKTPPISVEPYSTPNVTMHKRNGELLDKWYIFDEETSAQIEFRRPEVNRKPTKAQIRRHKEWVRGYRYDRPTRWTVDEIVGLCPYGAPGDRLWVREAFWGKHDTEFGDYGTVLYNSTALSLGEEFHPGIEHVASPECLNPPIVEGEQTVFPYDGEIVPGDWWLAPPSEWNGTDDYKNRGRWEFLPWSPGFYSKHPSIHMPRWASRITLEITGVRVERLQDISEADAKAEDCRADEDPYWRPTYSDPDSGGNPSARLSFEYLWSTIHAADGPNGWAANPWVWVVEFKRITPQ